jgi:hypothetical protein
LSHSAKVKWKAQKICGCHNNTAQKKSATGKIARKVKDPFCSLLQK